MRGLGPRTHLNRATSRVSQAPRCRARVCGHPVVTGEAMMQGRSKNRVRWLLDSGSRIPDQVCDLIRIPRPERHRIVIRYPSGRVCAAMRGQHFGPNKAKRRPASTDECGRRPTGSRIWRNEPNGGALGQWRRLRRKRLNRGTSRVSQARCRARVCGHPVSHRRSDDAGPLEKPGAVVTGFRLSDPGSSLRLDPGLSAGTTPNCSPLHVRESLRSNARATFRPERQRVRLTRTRPATTSTTATAKAGVKGSPSTRCPAATPNSGVRKVKAERRLAE